MLHSVHDKYGVHFSSLHFVQWYHDSHAGQSQVSPSSGSAYKSPFRLQIKPSPCKMNHFNWVHTSAHAPLPPNAVYAGNDTDGSPIYVGRAWVLKKSIYSLNFNYLSFSSHHEGDLLVAKVLPTKQVSYVSHNGMEVAKYQFEVSNKIKQKIENESRNRNGIFDPPTRLIR